MSSAVTFSLEPNEIEFKKKKMQREQKSGDKSSSFQNLHSRSTDAVASAPKRVKKRRVRKKDSTGMASLYEYEDKDENHNHLLSLDALQCEHCAEELDIGQILATLNPHIEKLVQQRLAVRERKLREEVVLEFKRRREGAKTV